jgi:hypothetical protein
MYVVLNEKYFVALKRDHRLRHSGRRLRHRLRHVSGDRSSSADSSVPSTPQSGISQHFAGGKHVQMSPTARRRKFHRSSRSTTSSPSLRLDLSPARLPSVRLEMSAPVSFSPQSSFLPSISLKGGRDDSKTRSNDQLLAVANEEVTLTRSTSDIDLARLQALDTLREEDAAAAAAVRSREGLHLPLDGVAKPAVEKPNQKSQRSHSADLTASLTTAEPSGLDQLRTHLLESKKILREGKKSLAASQLPPVPPASSKPSKPSPPKRSMTVVEELQKKQELLEAATPSSGEKRRHFHRHHDQGGEQDDHHHHRHHRLKKHLPPLPKGHVRRREREDSLSGSRRSDLARCGELSYRETVKTVFHELLMGGHVLITLPNGLIPVCVPISSIAGKNMYIVCSQWRDGSAYFLQMCLTDDDTIILTGLARMWRPRQRTRSVGA